MVLRASHPWARSHHEDRRFRLILVQTLLICLAMAAITSYIRIPVPEVESAAELPPRRVRLLTEPPPAAARPQSVPVPAAPPPMQAPAEPAPAPPPPVTPRQKAAASGVLAMKDALTELRSRTPRTGARGGEQSAAPAAPGQAETARPSALTADLTRGSDGITGGVAHRSVLGDASLPEGERAPLGGGGGEASAPTGGVSGASPGPVRSREEIQEVLDRNKGAMYRLYNRALQNDGSLQGKLVVSLSIAPAGHVTRCVIVSSDLGAPALEVQLVALISGIDFGNKPGVPPVTTRVPIEFFPR
jgi:outer membrane biosynthesis protein TonB